MIIPPIERLCSQSVELITLLSDQQGLKLSEFDATLDFKPPYVVWQIINANPQKYLDDVSDLDAVLLQIDVYAIKKSEARTIARLIRKAIELDCYIDSYTGTERDTETNLNRIRIDTSWHIEP